jgi:hypothetical protein
MRMRKSLWVLAAGSVLAVTFVACEPAEAAKMGKASDDAAQLEEAQKDFGLEAFTDWKKVGSFLLIILGAAALGTVLAYHPFANRHASVEDLEQPKIMIIYTVIGSLVGIVVGAASFVGLAIFGIGGLMRFRTELSAAKETGRVIMATILGIACGLQLWMVAVITTIFAWIVLYILESWVNLRLVVRGIRTEGLTPAADAYAKILKDMNCRFGSPRKNANKGQISFVLQHRRGLTHEMIEAKCNAEIPKELRGTIDWPEE